MPAIFCVTIASNTSVVINMKVFFFLLYLTLHSAYAIEPGAPDQSPPELPDMTVESIQQRVQEIKQELKKIERAIIERDELAQLWQKSSATLLKNHQRINQLLQNYRRVKQVACAEIDQVIQAVKYRKQTVDPSAMEKYEGCLQRLSGYIAHAQQLMWYAEEVTRGNEKLAAKVNIAEAVVRANILIREVLEEEREVLQDLKQDLSLFDEMFQAIRD